MPTARLATHVVSLTLLSALAACGGSSDSLGEASADDGGMTADGAVVDSASADSAAANSGDSAAPDGSAMDSSIDSTVGETDSGGSSADSSSPDTGADSSSGADTGSDSGTASGNDSGAIDSGVDATLGGDDSGTPVDSGSAADSGSADSSEGGLVPIVPYVPPTGAPPFTVRVPTGPAGFTSDGYVVFYELVEEPDGGSTYPVLAVPYSGGFATTIVPDDQSAYVVTSGPDALYFGGNGALSVWTSSTPLAQVGTNTQAGNAAANAQGDFYYFDNLAGSGTSETKDLYVSHSDGSGVTRLVQNGYRESCYFTPWWAGNSIAVQYCPNEITDGGAALTQPPTLSVFSSLFSGPSGTAFQTATASSLLAPNPVTAEIAASTDGTTIYAPLVNGSGAMLFAGTLATLQTFGSGGAGFGSFVGTSDSTVFYQANDALNLVTGATSPTPNVQTIVSSGVAGVYGLSPNGQSAMYYTSGYHGASDLWLTPTGVPSSAVSVASVTSDDAGTPLGSDLAYTIGGTDFTADSNFALYATSVSVDPNAGWTLVTLAARALTPTPSLGETVLGTNVAIAAAGAGSKVVFCANFSGVTYTCDLYSIDLATSTAPTLIMSQIEAAVAVSQDGTYVSFVTVGGAQPQGLFAIPIP